MKSLVSLPKRLRWYWMPRPRLALGDGARNTVAEVAADIAEGLDALGDLVGERAGERDEVALLMLRAEARPGWRDPPCRETVSFSVL